MKNEEIIAELNKIIATLKGEENTVKWNTSINLPKVDEPKKLWRVIQEAFYYDKKDRTSFDRYIFESPAQAAISAVIQCYENWSKINYSPKLLGSFPEYLKEKLL